MRRTCSLFLVALLLTTLGSTLFAQTAQLPTGSRLRGLVNTSDTPVAYIGGVLRTRFEDPAYTPDTADYQLVAGREFNLFSPENALKMKNLQGTEGVWDFSDAETAVQFAADHNAAFHGHVLIGGHRTYNPDWVYTTKTDIETVMNTEIDTVVDHWLPSTGRPPVAIWQVVNEAFDPHITFPANSDWTKGLRKNEPIQKYQGIDECHSTAGYVDNSNYDIFVDKIGTGYIEKAFRRAHQDNQNAVLIYNDSGNGSPTPNSSSAARIDYIYEMAQDFVNPLHSGGVVPINGMGFQAHMGGDIDPSLVRSNFERFSKLGLLIFMTELDWSVTGSSDPITNNNILDIQGRRYHSYFDAALRVPGFKGAQVWGISDAYTYHYNPNPGQCSDGNPLPEPLPFDTSYNAKPAYYAIQDALNVQYRDETLTDTGFESGTTNNWTSRNGGTLSIVSGSDAHSDLYGVKTNSRTVPNSGPSQDVTSNVLAQGSGRYFLRGWAKVASGTANMKLTVRLQDSSSTAFQSTPAMNVGTNWTLVSGWMKISWFKDLTSAIVYAETTDNSIVDFYLDDVTLSDGNLLADASFESGITGWTTNFGGTLASTDSSTDLSTGYTTYYYGNKGVQVTQRSMPYHGVSQDITSALLASGKGTYTLNGMMKLFPGSATINGEVRLRLRYDDVNHYYSVSGTVGADKWYRLSGTINLDWTTLQGAVLYVDTTTGIDSYYADDLLIRKPFTPNSSGSGTQ